MDYLFGPDHLAKGSPGVETDQGFAAKMLKYRRAAYVATIRKTSPSRSHRLPNLAPQIRTAFANMVWKADSNSPGEL